jgi:hypothetical protein
MTTFDWVRTKSNSRSFDCAAQRARRSAQDDRFLVVRAKGNSRSFDCAAQKARRFAQDDSFIGGAGKRQQRVLRLRGAKSAPLRSR